MVMLLGLCVNDGGGKVGRREIRGGGKGRRRGAAEGFRENI